jgi:hypothetical protein
MQVVNATPDISSGSFFCNRHEHADSCPLATGFLQSNSGTQPAQQCGVELAGGQIGFDDRLQRPSIVRGKSKRILGSGPVKLLA